MRQAHDPLEIGAADPAAAAGRRIVNSMCGVCPAGCGARVHVAGGRIERVAPLPGHPLPLLCPRGAAAPAIVHSPDRLLHPLRRRGPRGTGRLVRTSWDEALDAVAGELRRIARRHGPESLCVYTGRGNFEQGLNEMFAPAGTAESSANAFLYPLGSPNATGVGSLCYASYGMIAPIACLGEPARNLHADLEGADLVLVWGANPVTDSPPINLRRLQRARRRGARIVVIDPRRSETARATRAQWVGVRPGTDAALALGLMRVVIAEERHDRAFVSRWTHGFEALRRYVDAFDPARVARITGVPADTIVELARAVAATRRCAVLMYTGLEYSNCGVQAVRAVWSLQALTGHLDAPGGNVIRMPGRPRLNRLTTPQPRTGRPPIGAREHPVYCEIRQEAHAAALPRAILDGDPYPVRALVVSGASLVTAWPDPRRWRRALAALDLLVVVDRFPTFEASLADVVLPAATPFEYESCMLYEDGWLQLRRRAIAPCGEARSDYLVFAELAARLGYGERWPRTEEGMIRHLLRGTGVSLEALRASPAGVQLPMPAMRHAKYETGELRPDGRPGFDTPSGRFEFASEWLRSHGHPALPEYVEPVEGPLAAADLARAYPLVLTTGARIQSTFRSQHLNVDPLVSRQPWPLAHLNEDDARARGIADADAVDVVSPRGRVRFRARVSRDVVAGTVEVNMGGGGVLGPPAWRRANANVLTDPDNRDPVSGFPVYKALLCEVRRAAGSARARGPVSPSASPDAGGSPRSDRSTRGSRGPRRTDPRAPR